MSSQELIAKRRQAIAAQTAARLQQQAQQQQQQQSSQSGQQSSTSSGGSSSGSSSSSTSTSTSTTSSAKGKDRIDGGVTTASPNRSAYTKEKLLSKLKERTIKRNKGEELMNEYAGKIERLGEDDQSLLLSLTVEIWRYYDTGKVDGDDGLFNQVQQGKANEMNTILRKANIPELLRHDNSNKVTLQWNTLARALTKLGYMQLVTPLLRQVKPIYGRPNVSLAFIGITFEEAKKYVKIRNNQVTMTFAMNKEDDGRDLVMELPDNLADADVLKLTDNEYESYSYAAPYLAYIMPHSSLFDTTFIRTQSKVDKQQFLMSFFAADVRLLREWGYNNDISNPDELRKTFIRAHRDLYAAKQKLLTPSSEKFIIDRTVKWDQFETETLTKYMDAYDNLKGDEKRFPKLST